MTAAAISTGIAISGLVRKVIFAIAKRDIATRSFNKASSQLIKPVIKFCIVFTFYFPVYGKSYAVGIFSRNFKKR